MSEEREYLLNDRDLPAERQVPSLRRRWRHEDPIAELVDELAASGRTGQAELIASILGRRRQHVSHAPVLGQGVDRYAALAPGATVRADDPTPVGALDTWDF